MRLEKNIFGCILLKIKVRIFSMKALLNRIAVNPNVCFGKPCVKGTRIWVSMLLDLLADGMTIEDLLKEYPQLSRDDIFAAIAFGAEMSRERYVDIPTEAVS